jgi:hypothetical protein
LVCCVEPAVSAAKVPANPTATAIDARVTRRKRIAAASRAEVLRTPGGSFLWFIRLKGRKGT